MTTTRREFMARAGGAALGAAAIPSLGLGMGLGAGRRAEKKMKILILGGTGFLGPQIVRHAVERGHELTLFNRGKTAPELFPDLEHLEGDRYGDLASLKDAVADGRTWDAVIDTFTYVPKTVTDAMDVLMPAMGQFIVISTVSVYASSDDPGMDESGALLEIDDAVAAGITTHREVGVHYGAMKARVERAAEDRFPGRVTNIRPGLIVGPRDTTGRYTYWPVRGSEGGTMIGPGTGEDYVQLIDVRDLGDFTVRCAEGGHVGAYNAISPKDHWRSRDMVESAVRAGDAGTEVEWVDADFLSANGVQAWQHMPAWVPNSAPGYAGFGRASTARAIEAGLKTSPIDETARVTLEYYRTRGAEIRAERGDEFGDQWAARVRGGLDPDKEREVLAAWGARDD